MAKVINDNIIVLKIPCMAFLFVCDLYHPFLLQPNHLLIRKYFMAFIQFCVIDFQYDHYLERLYGCVRHSFEKELDKIKPVYRNEGVGRWLASR